MVLVPRLLATSFGAADSALSVTVVVLIAASAVLALAETSLVRMSKSRAKALVDDGHRGARSLRRLVEDPDAFLTPILLLVLLCQLVAATLIGVLAEHLFGTIGVVVATACEVILIFVLGEAVPKSWAVRNADRAALMTAPVVTAIVSFPPIKVISASLVGVARLLTPGMRKGDDQPDVTESELLAMADVAVAEDVIESEERALIHSIIEFGDTIVREVMVPRPDVTAVSADFGTGAALEVAIAAGFSRLPVFEESLDDVVGIAYTKDLVRAVRAGSESLSVRQFARPAHYVPETKRVAPLLREMQAQQYHLAVVVDEYGGTAGVVALEDLIEELVGEIVDEFDVSEPLIQPVSDAEYRISGQMAVDELNDLLRSALPVGDWDSIGGLLMSELGHIPVAGESVDAGDHVLTAEQVQGRRIRTVSLRRIDGQPLMGSTEGDEEPTSYSNGPAERPGIAEPHRGRRGFALEASSAPPSTPRISEPDPRP